jgi:hypothetical protein
MRRRSNDMIVLGPKCGYLGALRTVCAAALFAAGAGLAGAHTQSGSLGADAGATDYYQITCTDDGSGVPASMVLQVLNGPASTAQPVSALAHKDAAAANTTDVQNGDTVASPLVFINGGTGVYDVFVSKPLAGAVSYTLTFHCMTGPDGTGEHTGTTPVFKQNQ